MLGALDRCMHRNVINWSLCVQAMVPFSTSSQYLVFIECIFNTPHGENLFTYLFYFQMLAYAVSLLQTRTRLARVVSCIFPR